MSVRDMCCRSGRTMITLVRSEGRANSYLADHAHFLNVTSVSDQAYAAMSQFDGPDVQASDRAEPLCNVVAHMVPSRMWLTLACFMVCFDDQNMLKDGARAG